jgi:hypothetical protein
MVRKTRERADLIGAALAALLLSCLVSSPAWTQDAKPQKEGAAKKADKLAPAKAKPAAGAAAAPLVAPPGPDLIVVLVRTTLLTLNDALRSDNFTVLRDLASPQFRAVNTPGRLSQAFSDLARRGVDLSAVAILAPELAELPSLDAEKGVLRLKGYFSGKPVKIEFDLAFQAEAGRWKLLGLSVQPVAAEAQAAAPPPAKSAAPIPAAP